jgi:hypothetical protein
VKKWLLYAAAAYLSFAAMGMFTFMSMDAPYFESGTSKILGQELFLAADTYAVECLAIISTTKGNPFSALRHGSLRAVKPIISFAAGTGILYTAVRLITRAVAHNKKNTILLKLRI